MVAFADHDDLVRDAAVGTAIEDTRAFVGVVPIALHHQLPDAPPPPNDPPPPRLRKQLLIFSPLLPKHPPHRDEHE